MNLRVSLLLPVYNGSQFLPAAIESVLAQSHADFELLICDDCSADESPEILRFYEKQDSRVQVWRNDARNGLFANYNECLKKAKAEFIKPFAQDDVLNPEMLARCVEVLREKPDVSLVGVGRRFIDANGAEYVESSSILSVGEICGPNEVIPAHEVIRESLFPVRNIIGEPAAVMFRRDAIGDGFDSGFHHLGDLDYWLRILSHGDFFYVPERLVEFRWHSRSTSRANLKQLLFLPDVWRLGSKHEDLIKSIGRTRKRFEEQAVIDLARHIAHMVSTGELDPESFASGFAVAPDDAENLTAIAFQSLLALGMAENDRRPVVEIGRQVRIMKAIHSREKKLQSLLASKSWTATKVIRDLSKMFGISAADAVTFETPTASSDCSDAVQQQREYMKFLRRLHRKVTRSRSWAMTKPLRAFEQRLNLSRSAARLDVAEIEIETERQQLGESPSEPLKGFESYLAIAAIFRDEAPYLREWLEFHRLVGVEKFFLFNNLSKDDFMVVLEPYIEQGVVELIDWPIESTSVSHWNKVQCAAYDSAARCAKGRIKWLALLDVDEFLFPLDCDDLKTFFARYESHGGVCVNWRLFGTGGVRALGPSGLMIESLTRSASRDFWEHAYVKSIVQPDKILRCTDPHFCVYEPPFGQVTSEEVPFVGSLAPSKDSAKVRINHYRLRDKLAYELTKRKRYAGWDFAAGLDEEYHRALDEVYDDAILRFVPELRRRMNLDARAPYVV